MLVHSGYSADRLVSSLRAARARLDALADALDADQWIGAYAPTVNPPLWEYGHIVWFQEHWCLRLKPGVDPAASPLLEPLAAARRPWADWLYNSSYIPHTARWHAPLPDPQSTIAYGEEVLGAVAAKLRAGAYAEDFPYYVELSLYHELMHIEAWWMMWQEHGYSTPAPPSLPRLDAAVQLHVGPGPVRLGTDEHAGFVFDNEKWAHTVDVGAYAIDAQPVSCGEFADFVDRGGYRHDGYWTAEGIAWRAGAQAEHPLYWRRHAGAWQLRRFDRWLDLVAEEPVIHVNRHEAQAYCAWRGRTLPSAAQWLRASTEPGFVHGRCWEWTRDAFAPYLGFTPDPYRDYSAPWFHTHAEVRGAGSWVTDPALARATYRNFFMPHRRDPFIGFRTAGV